MPCPDEHVPDDDRSFDGGVSRIEEASVEVVAAIARLCDRPFGDGL